eukprot:jgi/Mesen1/9906/ME000070S09195
MARPAAELVEASVSPASKSTTAATATTSTSTERSGAGNSHGSNSSVGAARDREVVRATSAVRESPSSTVSPIPSKSETHGSSFFGREERLSSRDMQRLRLRPPRLQGAGLRRGVQALPLGTSSKSEDSSLTGSSYEDRLLDELLMKNEAYEGLDSSYLDQDEEEEEASFSKSRLEEEEQLLEDAIVATINRRDWAVLQPNSGQSVKIGEHDMCISLHEELDSGHRIWEWHGHIMLYEDGEYNLEYVYGNHYEPIDDDLDPLERIEYIGRGYGLLPNGRGVGLGNMISGVERCSLRRVL